MHLIKIGKYSAAERSFRYYKNIKDSDNIHDQNKAMEEFEIMKIALTKGDPLQDAITLKDFCKFTNIYIGTLEYLFYNAYHFGRFKTRSQGLWSRPGSTDCQSVQWTLHHGQLHVGYIRQVG